MPDSMDPEKIQEYCRSCSRDDFPGLAKKLFSTGQDSLGTLEGKAALLLFFGKWGEADPLAALAFARKMSYYHKVKSEIIEGWGGSSVQEALEFLERDSEEERVFSRNFSYYHQGALRANQSVDEALDWALKLPPGDRGSGLGAVLDIMARVDPERAVKIATENHLGSRGTIALEWGRHDWVKAFDWANTFSEWDRMYVLRAVCTGAFSSQPDAAVKIFRSFIEWENREKEEREKSLPAKEEPS